jgi:hypothetical protein
VAPNAASAARNGTITVAGLIFTVAQAGAPATACAYTVAATGWSRAAGGYLNTFNVTAPAGCGWTASSSTSWLTVTAGASGSGSGSSTVFAAANDSGGPRTAVLAIAGYGYTITEQ